MWLLLLGLLGASVLYIFYREKYSRFSKYGVNCPWPVPLLGNMTRITLGMEHFFSYVERMYNIFPNDRFIGSYGFVRPVVILKDLDLIKKITITDFNSFSNHVSTVDPEMDTFFGKFLVSLKDQQWRDVRSTVTPAFTGSKIRLMIPFMKEVADYMTELMKKNIKETGSDVIEIDIQDFVFRYSIDVVKSCAFGLKVDPSIKDDEFFNLGKSTANYGILGLFKQLGYTSLPKPLKKFLAAMVSSDVEYFFKNLIAETMKAREIKSIVRPDMIQMMIDAKRGKLDYEAQDGKDRAEWGSVDDTPDGILQKPKTWDDSHLMAQIFSFLVSASDTDASTLIFLLLELGLNPDIQETLYQEIKANHDKQNGKLDFNSILTLTYLDNAVSETLRLWNQSFFLNRLCEKDYNLGKANDKAKDYILRKGEAVNIPMWAIHRDAKYFPNPTKFDPDRFKPENMTTPFAYMPFGIGLRNCIGSRFVMSKTKVMVYQFILNFKVSPGKKLRLPLTLSKNKPSSVMAEGGHWLQIKIRK